MAGVTPVTTKAMYIVLRVGKMKMKDTLMMQIDVRYQNVILRVNHMEFAQVLTFVHAKLVGKTVSRYDVRYDVRLLQKLFSNFI